jgi:hypothetical protein
MSDFGPLKDYIELVERGIEVRGYLTRKNGIYINVLFVLLISVIYRIIILLCNI